MFISLFILSFVFVVVGVGLSILSMGALDGGVGLAGVLILVLGVCGCVCFGISAFEWEKAKATTEFLNRRYDSNYTVKEVFYNRDLIPELEGGR